MADELTLAEVVEGQTAELERLQLQYERDQSAYRLMQKGMESQAELMDDLKQQARSYKAVAERLAAAGKEMLGRVHEYEEGGGKLTPKELATVGALCDAIAAAREAGIKGE